ncbi:hypothetical protein BBUCA112A_D0022 (plasmid) [Borreliella burgdorferi CA-11.2A]|nr:hypothetical protein BBUCA112A_D0022 [Borreliella burgdorferi CA-11.2A]
MLIFFNKNLSCRFNTVLYKNPTHLNTFKKYFFWLVLKYILYL